jgi:TrmH family RNA methyltransferase
MHIIDSAQNATFKKLLSLTTAKGLKKEKLFLLSGDTLVREFLKKPHLKIIHEIINGTMKALALPAASPQVIQLNADLFHQLDVIGTHGPLLVLEQPDMLTLSADALNKYKPDGVEVVTPVGDPGNLGAIIRSCEAFGVERVLLTEEAAHPYLPKSVKASAGSVLRVALTRGPALKDFPASTIGLDAGGESLYHFTWPKNAFLAVGEEGQGLRQAPFKKRISIPTQNVESLNAAVAVGVALAVKRSRE